MTDKDDFNLREAIDRYASHLAHDIRSRRRRAAVKQEYAEHLEDAIYAYTLQGMEETEAYHRACEDLGDASKLQTMLAVVHNKDRLPRYVRYPLFTLLSLLAATSYFWISNESFRAWYVLLLQLSIPVWVYYFILFCRAFKIRRSAIQKLRTYAKENGHKLQIFHPYRSLLRRTTLPEVIYETVDKRYIISLFSTVRLKKTLHLSEHGFYNYSAKKGYAMMFMGRPHMHPGYHDLFLPKNMRPRQLYHTHLYDVPYGMHAMPTVRYEDHHSPDKQNVHVLMLNPIPFDVDYLRDGHIEKVRDDALLGDVRLWSASGFLSYIEGERIKCIKENNMTKDRANELDKLRTAFENDLRGIDAEIIDIYRAGNGRERTLTAVLHNDLVGYFCIQQTSGSYTGLAYRYQIILEDEGALSAESYEGDEGYGSWIPNVWYASWVEREMNC